MIHSSPGRSVLRRRSIFISERLERVDFLLCYFFSNCWTFKMARSLFSIRVNLSSSGSRQFLATSQGKYAVLRHENPLKGDFFCPFALSLCSSGCGQYWKLTEVKNDPQGWEVYLQNQLVFLGVRSPLPPYQFRTTVLFFCRLDLHLTTRLPAVPFNVHWVDTCSTF